MSVVSFDLRLKLINNQTLIRIQYKDTQKNAYTKYEHMIETEFLIVNAQIRTICRFGVRDFCVIIFMLIAYLIISKFQVLFKMSIGKFIVFWPLDFVSLHLATAHLNINAFSLFFAFIFNSFPSQFDCLNHFHFFKCHPKVCYLPQQLSNRFHRPHKTRSLHSFT